MLPPKVKASAAYALLLLLLILSLFMLAEYILQKPSVQNYLIGSLADAAGCDLRAESVDLNLWRGIGIRAFGVEVRSRRGPEKLEAASVRIVLDLGKLLRGGVRAASVYVYRPRVEIDLWRGWELFGKKGGGEFLKNLPPLGFPAFENLYLMQGTVRTLNSPLRLEGLSLSFIERGFDPASYRLEVEGTLLSGKRAVPLRLDGTLSNAAASGFPPNMDLRLRAEGVPVQWVPVPGRMSLSSGKLGLDLEFAGRPGAAMEVSGRISGQSLEFSLIKNYKKDYVVPRFTLDFTSHLDGMKIIAPGISLLTPDLSLTADLLLDFYDKENPYLELKTNGAPMPVEIFCCSFPSPLLPEWLENDLFPILHKGDVTLSNLFLKGHWDQIKHLDREENRSTLSLELKCDDLEVSGAGIPLPFQGVSAQVGYGDGEFRITGLKAGFGRSRIRDAAFKARDILDKNRFYEIRLDGVFEIEELLQAGEMDFLESYVHQVLEEMKFVTGRLSCDAIFIFQNGWPFPRAAEGVFELKDCVVRQQELFLPLTLKQADIRIDPEEGNRFMGIGAWGSTSFDVAGIFDHGEKIFQVRQMQLSAGLRMEEIIHLLYGGSLPPLSFSKPVISRIHVRRQEDRWSCKGRIDLEGIVLESEGFYMAPPGDGDQIRFDLDLSPGNEVMINRIRCRVRGSSLELTGFYNLCDRDNFTLNLSVPLLSMEDLGLRFKPKAVSSRGTLQGEVKILSSRSDPLGTMVIGRLEGKELSFFWKDIASPVEDLHFDADFSGKRVDVDRCRMRVGESLLELEGHLTGWSGLKGDLQVRSGNLAVEDFLMAGGRELKPDMDKGPPEIFKKVDLAILLDVRRGRWRGLEWGPLKADLSMSGGEMLLRKVRIDLENGYITSSGRLRRGQDPELFLSAHLVLHEQQIGDACRFLGINPGYLAGEISLEALVCTRGKRREDLLSGLSGSAGLVARNGFIRKSNVFIKVLDFLSLQNILRDAKPHLPEEGFCFDDMQAHVFIDKGVLRTDDFRMRSPVFNAVASGEADLAADWAGFDLGVHPIQTVDTVISKIPLLGYILTGKKRSILTYYFRVEGPLFDPKVQYVPFRKLGSGVAGILKRLFLTPFRVFKGLPPPRNGSPGPEEHGLEKEY